MRFARLVLLALIPFLSGSPASAQNAGQILDFFAGQVDREIARQQNRQIQRQQQQQINQNWQIFLAAWNECFDNNILERCDFALTYPNIGADNYQRLQVKRAEIVAAIQAQEEAARREQAERAAQERQRRIEAAEAERQRSAEAANEARRLQQEREQEAARLRQQEFDRQRAEAEQARRERIAEQRHLAGMRALITALQGCQRFDPDSCDRALASEHANPDKLDTMREWRTIGVNFGNDRAACQSGAIDACDRALASRAVTDADRQQLTDWRIAASPINRALASLSAYSATAIAAAQSLPATIGELPLSTQITGGVAAVLAFALVAAMWRRFPAVPSGAEHVVPPPLPEQKQRRQFTPGIRRWLHGAADRILAWLRATGNARAERVQASNSRVPSDPTPTAQVQPPPIPAGVAKKQPTPLPDTVDPPSVAAHAGPAAAEQVREPVREQLPVPVERPDRGRDTPAAIIALQLANAYIDEVRKTATPEPDDKAGLREALNTLALATKQLAVAEQKDPDAIAEIDCDGEKLSTNLADLQSEVLLQEGAMLWRTSPGRAMKALERAIAITPDQARPYYLLGLIHSGEHNPQRAATALQKAVELGPTNIEYRKALDRARNIGGGEVVGYKVTRAGERVYDTAIGVANTGIKAWNIFAIIYNIITAPIRIPLKIVLWFAGHK